MCFNDAYASINSILVAQLTKIHKQETVIIVGV